MSDRPPPGLFPLPLSTWELYMLLDDCPAYPMTSVIDVRVSGRLDEDVFHAALADVLRRHPLLGCLVERRRLYLPCWVPAPQLEPALDWGPAGAPLLCPHGVSIDLRRELGWRLWVRQGEQEATVTIQLHHSVCDGVAILEVIGDLLAAYGLRVAEGGQKPQLAPLDQEKLRLRDRFDRTPPPTETPWRDFFSKQWQSFDWFLFAPKPLLPPAERPRAPADPPELPGNIVHVLDKAEWKGLRREANRRDISPNDLLVRDLLLALERWNAGRRPNWRGRLRVTMPVNLRELEHEAMPAANAVSHTFLTRKRAACRDPERLLAGVRAEIEQIVRQRQGLWFLDGIDFLRWAPPLKPLLELGRCFSTSVLTNLGNPARRFTAKFPYEAGRAVIGDLKLLSIVGGPPVRPKTRAVFGLTVCGGELMIATRCDPHLFSPDDAARLTALFGEQLRTTAGGVAGGR